MSENAEQPVFSIEKLYVKDLSVEVPNAPQIYLEREAPQINVQLRTDGNAALTKACSKSSPDRHRHRQAAATRRPFSWLKWPRPASSRSATFRRKTSIRS
jgi:hypothetical protein